MSRAASAAGQPFPPRPYLPPSFAGAAVAFAAAALLMQQGWEASRAGTVSAVVGRVAARAAAGTALCLVSCLLARSFLRGRASPRARWLREAAAWAWCALALVSLSSVHAVASRARQLEALRAGPVSSFAFLPRGDERASSFGVQVSSDVYTLAGDYVATASLTLDEMPAAGSLVLVGRLVPWEEDPWDRRAYLSGEVAEVSAARVVEVRAAPRAPIECLRARALEAIAPDASPARALIAGIVCGRTTELSAGDAQEWFSATGTSHLVAVSGSHLALVSSLAGLALARLRLPLGARTTVLLLLSGAYVVFTGCAPSAVRSLVMVAAASLPRVLGRRAHGPSGLSLAVMGLLALDPGIAYDLGFQLSVASVLSITLFFRYLSWHLQAWGVPRVCGEPLALTLSAQWATLPITVPVFGEVSLVAPAANLALGPIMSALLMCGLVLAPVAAAVPAAAPVALAPLDLLASLALFVARLFAGVPFACIPVDAEGAGMVLAALLAGLLAVAYGLWARVPARRAVAAAAVLVLVAGAHAVRWRWLAPPSVTVLDVGQGDAILLRDGAAAVLVDCGVDDAVGAALARNNVSHLDAVVITHWDRDHWGGLPTVLDAVGVDSVVVAEGAAAGMPAEAVGLPRIVELDLGDVLVAGGFRCRAVWPRDAVAGSENADSLVLDVRYGEEGAGALSVLLTGDTEADQAESYAGAVGDIDVLKMGHHGSAASVSEEMLDALNPEVAVASAGEGNPYGHPDPAAVALVGQSGARFVCTIDEGDIVIAPSSR